MREELACVPALRYLGLRFEAESDPLCNFVAEATTRAYARMPALRVLAVSPWASTQILQTLGTSSARRATGLLLRLQRV